MKIVLNNIIENANNHAFVDDSKKYILEFRLSLQIGPSVKPNNEVIGSAQTFLRIEIANNGLKFPENFSLDKFIRKNAFAGSTGNTGIGGYDINEILKHLNGGMNTFDLVTDDFTNEFVTKYIFLLPITN
ncbi:hypothetical protein D3C87_1707310 [compost metagenome]